MAAVVAASLAAWLIAVFRAALATSRRSVTLTLLTAAGDLNLGQAAVLAGLPQGGHVAAWPAGLTGPNGSRPAFTGVIACRQPGDAEAGLHDRLQPVGGDRRAHPGHPPASAPGAGRPVHP
jgi:hypothetical protein